MRVRHAAVLRSSLADGEHPKRGVAMSCRLLPMITRTPETVAGVNASMPAREQLTATSPTTLVDLLEFAAAHNEQDFLIFDGEEEMAIFMESLAQPHVIM